MAVRQRTGGMMILVVSIIAGLLAALMSVSFLRGIAQTTTVYVATREIPAFTKLEPSMFTAQQVSASAVPADAVKDVGVLTGRFARTLLLQGDVIRQAHLATSSGNTGSLAAKLTESGRLDTRAVGIPVDAATGVGGMLQPGDMVDLIASFRQDGNGPGVTYSKLFAQRVPVLHRTEADSSGKATVIVQVTPQQAEEIAHVQSLGKVTLALSPYKADAQPVTTPGTTSEGFVNRHSRR